MSANFTIAYRAPGIVDMLINKQADVESYVIKASANSETPAFVTLFTVGTGAGYLDPSIDRNRLSTMPGTNRVRVVFNPSLYGDGGAINAGILDTDRFQLMVQPVSGGVPGPDYEPGVVRAHNQYDEPTVPA